MPTLLDYTCAHCQKPFQRLARHVAAARCSGRKPMFCSLTCTAKSQEKGEWVTCKNCSKDFYKRLTQIKKHPNHFCTQSCAATYNNTHKTHGTRRSKLEAWLEVKLKEVLPNLDIHFNRKDAINAELDIYIPSLKLAFELNGIYHYEPIHGQAKLNQIQSNDHRKFQACLERSIELCIIDTSQFTYFKEQRALEFLAIIVNILAAKGVYDRRYVEAC